MIELYAKLKFNKVYNRHPCSLFRILRKLGFYKDVEKKVKPYIPKPYNTPKAIGIYGNSILNMFQNDATLVVILINFINIL